VSERNEAAPLSWRRAIAGLALLLLLAGCGASTSNRITTPAERPAPSLAAFERVQPGMSLAQVEAILGRPTLGPIPKLDEVFYTWGAGGFRPFAVVTFNEARVVVSTNQQGLR
jgi:hypothetical protein